MFNNQLIEFLAEIAIIFPAFLIALSFHEFSHALMAHLLGDDTAKDAGRMTINPLAHLDFWGTVFLLLLRIGWAKPVPLNFDNFKHPRIYSVLTALAGPFANFLLALGSFFVIKFLPIFNFPPAVFNSFMQVFEATAYVNVMLGTFNLLPFPPLDGSHFLFALFYKKFPQFVIWLYQYSIFILLAIFIIPTFRNSLINLILFVYNLIRGLVF
jgi:Zn-dependent protease